MIPMSPFQYGVGFTLLGEVQAMVGVLTVEDIACSNS